MLLSQIGFETKKVENLDPMFPAQDILLQTGQLVQFASGIFAYGNVPLRAMEKLKGVIKDVLDEHGCVEISLPILQTQSLWEESGRWKKYVDDGTMMIVKTEKGNYGLAPTAEEAVVNFAKGRVKSYKSCPVCFYQIGDKYRNELRNRGYMLRGKAFSMMDAYSFDTSEQNMDVTYKKMRVAYLEIFKRLGIDIIPVKADSGAMGGDSSEEFMLVAPYGEDTIYVDKKDKTKAYNLEVLEKYGIKDLNNYDAKKAVECGHIFQLGQKYSKAMNATYVGASGKDEIFQMGCYGIGVSRLLACIYEMNVIKDDKNNVQGISLPTVIAPYRVQIVTSPKRDADGMKLYKELRALGVDCIYDDRKEATFGVKLKDAKIFGTPYIAILGDRQAEIEIENTKTGAKVLVKGAKDVQQKCV